MARVCVPDLSTKIREEMNGISNNEEKVGVIAGLLLYGRLSKYPDENIIKAIKESHTATLTEIDSAIQFYASTPWCDDPKLFIAQLRICLLPVA